MGLKQKNCGLNPSGKVNKNAKKILIQNKIWSNNYHSKHLNEVIDEDFNLVVTVCDHVKENCPNFPKYSKDSILDSKFSSLQKYVEN